MTTSSVNSTVTSTSHSRVILRARPGWQAIDIREIWRYRELLWFMALREIQVRYKQTVLGVAWAVIQPLMLMVIFNVLFSLLLGESNRPSVKGVPYSISTLCALLPWQFFASALTGSGNSLVNNTNLVTKVYFPRLIMPMSTVISSAVDFLFSAGVLVIMMFCYWASGKFQPEISLRILTLPFFVLLAAVAALSIGLWLAALNIAYRDFKFIIPFIIQLGMYLSPVVYTTAIIPARWRFLYGLNPMVGVIDGFRWAMLGRSAGPGWSLAISAMITTGLLVGGLYYFRRMERTFADVA